MQALAWHGNEDVRVDTVPDPSIEKPTDAIIRVTSSGICGSDLHLYSVLGAFIDEGDILGHEPMGIVEDVGSEVTQIARGDRVVIPFNISCGHSVQHQEDPLGVDAFATHHVPLEQAPHAYAIFQKKQDGAFKILLRP